MSPRSEREIFLAVEGVQQLLQSFNTYNSSWGTGCVLKRESARVEG